MTRAAPGEGWPASGGEPLPPLLQFRADRLPVRPPALRDVALLTLFLDPAGPPFGRPNGDGWCLRTYSSAAGTVSLAPPAGGVPPGVRPFPLRVLEPFEDRPDWEDQHLAPFMDALLRADPDAFDDPDVCGAADGLKVGGFPRLIQAEPFPGTDYGAAGGLEFAFQIDSTDKGGLNWVDGGVAYFGRRSDAVGPDARVFDCQFY